MSTSPTPNCPWRKPTKHPLDGAEKIAHVAGGAMFAALGGVLGCAIGPRFTAWVSDNWYEFHRYYSEFRRY